MRKEFMNIVFPQSLRVTYTQSSYNIHISAVPTCNTAELVKTIYIKRS